MKLLAPDISGFVDSEGVRIHYEVSGNASATILLLPTWTIVHKRMWKAQVPYLSRHFRVVSYDGPGNGLSDRPAERAAYHHDVQVRHALAVLDATGTDSAVLVGLSQGAAGHCSSPHNTATAPWVPSSSPPPSPSPRGTPPAPPHCGRQTYHPRVCQPSSATRRSTGPSTTRPTGATTTRTSSGSSSACASPNPTRPSRSRTASDGVSTPLPRYSSRRPTLRVRPRRPSRSWCRTVSSPSLAIHGDHDLVGPISRGQRLAELTGGDLVVVEGAGHLPVARDPVKLNLLIRDFALSVSR